MPWTTFWLGPMIQSGMGKHVEWTIKRHTFWFHWFPQLVSCSSQSVGALRPVNHRGLNHGWFDWSDCCTEPESGLSFSKEDDSQVFYLPSADLLLNVQCAKNINVAIFSNTINWINKCQTLHGGTFQWALPVHSTLNDPYYISKSQHSHTVLT